MTQTMSADLELRGRQQAFRDILEELDRQAKKLRGDLLDLEQEADRNRHLGHVVSKIQILILQERLKLVIELGNLISSQFEAEKPSGIRGVAR